MNTVRIAFLILSAFLLTGCNSTEELTVSGYVEGEFVMIAPTSSGLLSSLSVRRGQDVLVGDKLFSLDLTELSAQKKIVSAEISRLNSEINNSRAEYNRALSLNETGVASKAKLDDAATKLHGLVDTLNKAEQNLVQITKQLHDAMPLSPVDAIVQDVFYEVGEYVVQGKPVINLLPYKNIKIRFFVSQKHVAALMLQQPITVRCDGCLKPIAAKISYISSNAEYTPPVIYSVESRDKLVFLIEAEPDEYIESLRPGLPVSVSLEVNNGR